MNFVDLHCDTLSEMLKYGKDIKNNGLHVDFDKINFNYIGVFAAFIPDGITNGKERYKKLKELFLKIKPPKNITALFSVENGGALIDRQEELETLFLDGVKFITLTWNGDNNLASGIFGSGGGLTPLGKKILPKMKEVGIRPDLSHLNERGFYYVAENYDGPLIATHSNLRRVKNHPRNLTDEQFSAVVRSKGVVGINFYKEFLGSSPLDKIYENICQMLSLGGENNIAIGSDFDGAEIEKSISGIEKIEKICNYLLDRKINEQVLEKIFYKNALRII